MTIMIDEDGRCMMGTKLSPPPGWVPPTIAESLAHGFEEQAVYYDYEGRPVALWPDWDYAEDWSAHPLRELHPFIPLKYGKEVTQEEFLRMVKAIHGLA